MGKPYEQYVSYRLSAATLLAIRVAKEKEIIMREGTIADYRESQAILAETRIIPARVHCQPGNYAGVPCEWVIRRSKMNEERVVLYLHGGSWMYGTMDSARPVGVLIAEATGFRCLMVDYRLAPEHPYPAGYEDAYRVYCHLLDQGLSAHKIALFGDSAGGNLCLGLIGRLKSEGKPLPSCVALASPVTDIREDSGIVTQGGDLIWVQHQGREQDIFSIYLGETFNKLRGLPSISPITGNLEGLPPMLIHTGGAEPLVEDNLAYGKKVYEAGGSITVKIWEEMFHDFTVVGKTLRESVRSMKEMGAFITSHTV